MKQWKLVRIGADYNEIAKRNEIHPVIARILRNRGVQTDEQIKQFLNPSLSQLHAPKELCGMDKAIKIIGDILEKGHRVRIIGDYDIDGICSTVILLKGLRLLGVDADYAVPNRIKDGYGLNEALIGKAIEDKINVIITCDNGIAASKEIQLAKDAGMTVIVTDHHEVPFQMCETGKEEILPPADVIIDPKQARCEYPFKEICGGMIAFKLIEQLYRTLNDRISQQPRTLSLKSSYTEESSKNLLAELVELAAFATVGDVMPLIDENRSLVANGIASMQNSKNIGIRALCNVNLSKEKRITTYSIGFVLGPCINATGRLDTAERAIELLMAEKLEQAALLANELKALNENRKLLTIQGYESAVEQIEHAQWKEQPVYVIFLPECHESLAGIIAGRIKEKYYRPTFVLTKGEEGVKGSGRSIETYDMYDNLTACKDLFTKFGGHKMAAGVSLPLDNVEEFRRRMNDRCKLTAEDLTPVLRIDVDLPFAYAEEDFLEQLEQLEPFGVGNPKPVFALKNVTFHNGRLFGKSKNFASFQVTDPYHTNRVIKYFGDLVAFHHFLDDKYGEGTAEQLYCRGEVMLTVAYYPEINDYNGKREIQLLMQDYT